MYPLKLFVCWGGIKYAKHILPSPVLCRNIGCCGGVSPCSVLTGILGNDVADDNLVDSSRGFNTVTCFSGCLDTGAGEVDVDDVEPLLATDIFNENTKLEENKK